MGSVESFVVDFVGDRKSYLDSVTSKYRKEVAKFVPCSASDLIGYFNWKGRETEDPCKTGFDTLVLNWYIRLLHPSKSYLHHLDYFRKHDRDGGFTDYLAGGSIHGFRFFEHKRKHKEDEPTWVAIPKVECDNYNPCAKFKSIRSSASRTYSQLKNLDGCNNIIFLDLTFPKEISRLLNGSSQPSIIKIAHQCVDRFYELLRGELESHINENKPVKSWQAIPSDASFGYQYNIHLWKTQEPTKPHMHIHLDFLWAFYDGNKLQPLKFHDKGKPLGANFVRALWKEAVYEICDYDYGDKDPDLYLAWAPLSWGSTILHRLKYRRRKPVTDLGEYYLDNDFDPDSFNDGFNEFLLNYVNKSYSHGFWTFLARLLKSSSSGSANVKVCPICGQKVNFEGYFPIEEAIFDRVVIQDRHGSFYSVEPPPQSP